MTRQRAAIQGRTVFRRPSGLLVSGVLGKHLGERPFTVHLQCFVFFLRQWEEGAEALQSAELQDPGLLKAYPRSDWAVLATAERKDELNRGTRAATAPTSSPTASSRPISSTVSPSLPGTGLGLVSVGGPGCGIRYYRCLWRFLCCCQSCVLVDFRFWRLC